MARTDTLGNFLTDVADAIREKKGTSDTIQASNFDTEITNLPGGSGLDWRAIGYETAPQSVINGFNYAKQIKDNWVLATSLQSKFVNDKNLVYMPLVDTSITTSMFAMFQNCTNLINIPQLDTSNVTNMGEMFFSCNQLQTIPQLDTNNVTNMSEMFDYCGNLLNIPLLNTSNVESMNNMFNSCNKLTDEALNNILKMCINATSYTGTKTLKTLGMYPSTYPASRMEALSNYQDFINAGWTLQ